MQEPWGYKKIIIEGDLYITTSPRLVQGRIERFSNTMGLR